jgi:hypothetical protein
MQKKVLIRYFRPVNFSYFFNFGSLAGLCFFIQILIGIFLAMFYSSSFLIDFSFMDNFFVFADKNIDNIDNIDNSQQELTKDLNKSESLDKKDKKDESNLKTILVLLGCLAVFGLWTAYEGNPGDEYPSEFRKLVNEFVENFFKKKDD